jgi:D-alanyl-D-alanine carboxypeptidase
MFTQRVLGDPTHRWTRLEQLQSAMEWGEPYGAPGEVFHYCDTGYILLGQIIEDMTGESLGAGLRELLAYQRLGLSHTWLETIEPPPAGALDRAHQYFGSADTYGWDPSFDLYGGGGLVAPVGDVARFIHALFNDGIYAKAGTCDTMLTTLRSGEGSASDKERPYRMGIVVSQSEGLTTYSHTGFWGTAAMHAPGLNATIAVAVTQQQTTALRWLLNGSIALLREYHEE